MKQNVEINTSVNGVSLLIKVFFLFIAASFFLVVLTLTVWNLYQITIFAKTTAVVSSINITKTSGKSGATFYDYKVSFQTPEHTIYTSVGKTVFYQAFSEGESVSVFYDPQNPFAAFVNSFSTIWFVPTILFFIGAFMLVLSNPRINDLRMVLKILKNENTR